MPARNVLACAVTDDAVVERAAKVAISAVFVGRDDRAGDDIGMSARRPVIPPGAQANVADLRAELMQMPGDALLSINGEAVYGYTVAYDAGGNVAAGGVNIAVVD